MNCRMRTNCWATDLAALLGEPAARTATIHDEAPIIFQDGRNGRYSLGGKFLLWGGGARYLICVLSPLPSYEIAGSDAADSAVVGARQRRAHCPVVRGRLTGFISLVPATARRRTP